MKSEMNDNVIGLKKCNYITSLTLLLFCLVMNSGIRGKMIYAQVNDSLQSEKQINTNKSSPEKEPVNKFFLMHSNPEKARKFSQNRLNEIEMVTENYPEIMGIYNIIGSSFFIQNQFNSALEYYSKLLDLAINAGFDLQKAFALNNIGLIYTRTEKYKEALDYIFKAYEVYRSLEDTIQFAGSYNNIGRIYFEINDLEKAINNFRKAYSFFDAKEYYLGLASVSNHIAMYHIKNNEPDSARIYFDMAINYAKVLDNNFILSLIYLEKGDFHRDLGENLSALDSYEKSQVAVQTLENQMQSAFVKISMAKLFLNMNKMREAKDVANQALVIADEFENNLLNYKLHSVFSEIYEKTGEFELAFRHHKTSIEQKALLFDQTQVHEVYSVEMDRLNRQMEVNELELKKQELLLNQRRNTIILIIVLSLSLMVILTLAYYFVIFRIRQKQKDRLHQDNLKHTLEKNQAVLEAESSERKRLASELHDGIGTQLSLTKLNISNVLSRDDLPIDKKSALLHSTMKNIDEIIREVKNISNSMTPLALSEKGLKEAIKELVVKFSQIKSYRFRLNISGLNGSLKLFAEQAIYRTIQEIVTNTIKHAQGSEITIQIIQDGQELTIMIEDDGKGFDWDDKENKKGFGLKNAISRMESLNGQLLIDSVIGRGSIITIIIPLENLLERNTINPAIDFSSSNK